MLRPDKGILQSLARLHDSFPEIIKWFQDSFEDQKDVNIDLTGEPGIKGQGKAEELREIIQFIKTAPEVLKQQGESIRAPHQTRGY